MRLKELRAQIGDDEIATTIFCLVLGVSKSTIFQTELISARDAKRCLRVARAYKKGIPIAYSLKKWYFLDMPLYINRHVLVPRFDTEILATSAINFINCNIKGDDKDFSVLDMCTGSGCIALAIARDTNSRVVASDISRKALSVARRSADSNSLSVQFVRSDLFENIDGKFDLIVSNPPYIRTHEIGRYDISTKHEPRIALSGGEDGLDFYRRIVQDAPSYLNKGGALFLEIDHAQTEDVKVLLQNHGFCDIEVTEDFCGFNRVIKGILKAD